MLNLKIRIYFNSWKNMFQKLCSKIQIYDLDAHDHTPESGLTILLK